MKTIYCIKTDGINGYIEGVNNQIISSNPSYHEKFGLIGSDKWITLYEAGKISKDVRAGRISYIGKDRYEPDCEPDVIEIETDRRTISYPNEKVIGYPMQYH